MSLSNQTVKNIYVANGVLQDFNITFQLEHNSQIEVYLLDTTDPLNVIATLQSNPGDYTLTGNPATQVNFVTPPANNLLVVIARKTPLTQEYDLLDSEAPLNSATEQNLDRIVEMIQELYHRAVLFPVYMGKNTLSPLPNPAPNTVLAINSTGDGLRLIPTSEVTLVGGYYSAGPSSPQILSNGGTINVSNSSEREAIYVKSSGGAVTLGATPINNGAFTAQELVIIGTSDVDTVEILSSSPNLAINGDFVFANNSMLELLWNELTSKWMEKSRRS